MKVYLPKNNSEWGIVVRPVGENVYKHIINFPNIDKRDEYIGNKFFEGNDPITFMKENGKKCQFNNLTSTKAMISFKISDFPDYEINDILNADYVPVLNEKEDFIYWYQVSPKMNGTNMVDMNGELDVFFTYWHLINIQGKVNLIQTHLNRKDETGTKWNQDSTSAIYNDHFDGGKKIIKQTFDIKRKSVSEFYENSVFDQITNDGIKHTGIFVFKSPTADSANTTVEFMRYWGQNFDTGTLIDNMIRVGYQVFWCPTNYIIKENRGGGNFSILALSDFLGMMNNAAYVTNIIFSNYIPINFDNLNLSTDLAGNKTWDLSSRTLQVTESAPSGETISGGVLGGLELTTQSPSGGVYTEKYRLRDCYAKDNVIYNKFELDLTDFGVGKIPNDEISNFQNGINDIVICNGNNETYSLPARYLGQIVEFDLVASVDAGDFTEHLYLTDFYENENVWEGLTTQNTNYLSFSNNESETYKLQNQSNIMSKKINGTLQLFTGLIAAPFKPVAGVVGVTHSVTNLLELQDIKRMPNTTSGSGYTTALDFSFLPNSLDYYARLESVYGNGVESTMNLYYKYGNSLQTLDIFKNYLNTRERFNFIQAEGIFNKISSPRLSSEIKQLISSSIENGITLWHYRDNTTWNGIVDYDSSNNEYVEIVSENEKV